MPIRISVAFDLAIHRGYDSDNERFSGDATGSVQKFNKHLSVRVGSVSHMLTRYESLLYDGEEYSGWNIDDSEYLSLDTSGPPSSYIDEPMNSNGSSSSNLSIGTYSTKTITLKLKYKKNEYTIIEKKSHALC